MSQDLPGALYPDDLSVFRCSLSAFALARLSHEDPRSDTGDRRAILPQMDAQHARELLARERARVERELADPEQKPHDPEDVPDPFEASDGGAEMVEDELSEAEDEPLREDLAAIERAERRLEQGTYGISVESGEPIPDARLQAIPWAERTAEEQARLDR
jgi:DnaK suppressor protein